MVKRVFFVFVFSLVGASAFAVEPIDPIKCLVRCIESGVTTTQCETICSD